MFQLHSDKLVK